MVHSRTFMVFPHFLNPRELEIIFIRPWKLRSAKKYFMEQFGPAFFMLPAYCVDCNKKPVYKEADAEYAARINGGRVPGDPTPRVEVGSLVPKCPECYWIMNDSSWDRFMVGFLDGTFTVEEFEESERTYYMNEKFVSETLNQNS